ncbi:MAG: hypothetical protein KDD62_03870, partial [Bdellovibrionales bacterium]|nr:hypothetical protein [Bdellovibrionales bacterium]
STDIATHLNWADYVFSGAGTTALETCCVGRGLFVCVLAENQKNVAKYLIDKGLATLMTLGAAEHLLESAQRIEKILGQENALREQIERQKLNFDGRGAEKICEIMEARSITE